MLWASSNGIVEGVSDTAFAPGESVTREQIATLLYRYAQYKGVELAEGADLSAYADAGQIGSWAYEALAWANAAGLVSGRSETELAPAGTALRSEVAAILARYTASLAA